MFMIAIFQKITMNNHPVLQIFLELKILISVLNFKIYGQPCQFEPEKQNQAISFGYDHSLYKAEEKNCKLILGIKIGVSVENAIKGSSCLCWTLVG